MIDLIKRSVKREFEHIRGGLGDFSQNVVGGIGALLSLITFIATVVVFIVLMSLFVSGGGYENIFDELFTLRGNASSFYKLPVLAILGVLNLGMLGVSYFFFFKNEKTGFRILGIIPFVVVLIGLITCAVVLVLYQLDRIEDHDSARSLVIGMCIAGLIAVVASLVMLLLREKVMSRSCLRLMIFSFVILPLFTLCVQNIGLLIVGILVFIVLCVVIHGAIPEGSGAVSSTSEKTVEKEKPSERTSPSGLTEEQRKAISDINREYKERSAAIVKAHNEVGAIAFSDATNKELKQLRAELESKAEAKGVKGKVSIY